jgi:endonuclease/exonuclease/phosphatase family metal-dependent hydrolase
VKSINKLCWILVVFLVLIGGVCFAENPRITVLTYNIRHGEGNDGKVDLDRIAAVINSVTPDLVALQEVDVKTTRSNGLDQAAELGKRTGLSPFFSPAIPYAGGQYGDATLIRESRFRNIASFVKNLPHSPDREQRSANERFLEWQGNSDNHSTVRFYCTHLDHLDDENDRLPQAKAINEWIFQLPNRHQGDDKLTVDPKTPAILTGDMNAQLGSETIEEFQKHWAITGEKENYLTWPSDKPQIRIDFIMYYPKDRWRVVETRVLDEPVASDHQPYLAVLELLQE